MIRSTAHDVRHAKMWGLAFLFSLLIGSCSVAYAYSGEQVPKTPTTQLVMALAASFGAKGH